MSEVTENWRIQTKKADFYGLAKSFGVSPYVIRLIRNRDLVDEEDIRLYLYGTREDLADPALMKDLTKAVRILQSKIAEGERIRIIGDYDADGINSIYILYRALRRVGAVVDWVIPDRIRDGYGLNENFVIRAEEDGVDTLLTCDNGIAAIDPIHRAKQSGMTVIVTDHHDIRKREDDPAVELLPEADAVVNPKQADCPYPFKGLCGAGVAFYLVRLLYPAFGIPEQEAWNEFLPFAAIATVADVMSLSGENRILVKEGIAALRKTRNPGLNALITVQNVRKDRISSMNIGFILAPVLNAGGRIDSAEESVKLLLAESEEEAMRRAEKLKSLNDLRKAMTEEGTELAVAQVESTSLKDDRVLVVFLPECHESIVGIIAGRLRERYNKPAIVLTRGQEGLKGSGRSTEAYPMFDRLCECGDLMIKFGGHPMAAGLSLPEENLAEFRRQLNERCRLTDDDLTRTVWIDMQMPFEALSIGFVEELELLEPFGTGNPRPVFGEQNVRILRASVFGRNRNVLKLSLANAAGASMQAVLFGDPEEFFTELTAKYGPGARAAVEAGRQNPVRMTMLYYPQIDTWGDRNDLQIKPISWRFR